MAPGPGGPPQVWGADHWIGEHPFELPTFPFLCSLTGRSPAPAAYKADKCQKVQYGNQESNQKYEHQNGATIWKADQKYLDSFCFCTLQYLQYFV